MFGQENVVHVWYVPVATIPPLDVPVYSSSLSFTNPSNIITVELLFFLKISYLSSQLFQQPGDAGLYHSGTAAEERFGRWENHMGRTEF